MPKQFSPHKIETFYPIKIKFGTVNFICNFIRQSPLNANLFLELLGKWATLAYKQNFYLFIDIL